MSEPAGASEGAENAAEPAGLYLHIPFCSAVCPYCDFAVLVGSAARRAGFVEALLEEIRLRARESEAASSEPWRFDTVYLGGGTPSLLAPRDLERILEAVRTTFELAPETRLTLEANPEDVQPETLAAWRELGVGTLSLGVQSFVAGELRHLGRRHGSAEARRATAAALATGFATVSIDLIFGLAGQDEAAWRHSLETAAALGPHHISCYQLEIHPRTTFGKRHARGELAELPEGEQAERFRQTHEVLAAAGYEAYEVSNLCRGPAHRSRHNRKYWRHVPYLGLGPSAHSFRGRRRWWNERHLAAWQRQIQVGRLPVAGTEELADADLALETLMLRLRTSEGLALAPFAARFGIDLEAANRDRLDRWRAEGLLAPTPGRLALTPRGMALADGLAASLELG